MLNLEDLLGNGKEHARALWTKHSPAVKKMANSAKAYLRKQVSYYGPRVSQGLQTYSPVVIKAVQKGINAAGPYVLANAGIIGLTEYVLGAYQQKNDFPIWVEESAFYTAIVALNAGILYPVAKLGVDNYFNEITGKKLEKDVKRRTSNRRYERYANLKTAAIVCIGALGYGHGTISDSVGNGIDRIIDDKKTIVSILTDLTENDSQDNNEKYDTDKKDKSEDKENAMTTAAEKQSKKTQDSSGKISQNKGSDALEDSLTEYVNDLRARKKARSRGVENYSVYVKDLHSGAIVADINSESQRMSASTIKLYVLAAAFQAIEDKKFSYSNSVKRDMEQMIRVSSNSATNKLIKKIGLENINTYVKKQGYADTVVDYIPASGRTLNNKTSAEDLAVLLEHLYKKDIPYATEMQRIMSLKSPGHLDRIFDRTCIPGTKDSLRKRGGYASSVKDKTGFIWGVNADAGVVYAHYYNQKDKKETNVPYIAVFIIEDKDAKSAGFRGNANAWGRAKSETIRSMSEAVYWHLQQTYSDIPARCEHNGVHPK